MRVDEIDFELPVSGIGLRAVRPRDSTRILAVHANDELDHRVRDLLVSAPIS